MVVSLPRPFSSFPRCGVTASQFVYKMKGTNTEYHDTPTSWHTLKPCDCFLCSDIRSHGLRPVRRSVKKDRKLSKFPTAFKKALLTRSRLLGRRLARVEWLCLRDAVRKQVARHVSPVTKELSSLASRVSRLELSHPTDLQQVSDAVALLQLQTQILKRQIFLATEEKTNLSESCSHLTNKLKIQVPGSGFVLIKIPGVGTSHANVPQLVTTVCETCRLAREDTIYGWSGTELQWSHIDISAFPSSSKLTTRSPLSYQFIWSAILDHKFNRLV
uniref:Uncharacterized protein n=1 Tax=Diplodia fraxini partitivirus 1 TaxID=3073354 RepID=A0AA51X279_9VIRU|nr:hypothetical protein [Diplodia fraxini partitivirus 1]